MHEILKKLVTFIPRKSILSAISITVQACAKLEKKWIKKVGPRKKIFGAF